METGLFAFYLVYFAAAFVWPTYRLWRRDRVLAVTLPNDDTPHGVVATGFKVLMGAIFAVLLTLVCGLPAALLGPLPWADVVALNYIGWALLVLSLIWIAAAQRQMGRSWRIGIPEGEQPALVASGVFARSRNPIFLGMRVNLLGLFLVLPNAVTLAALLAGEILMQVQVRLEEQFLGAKLGEAYEAYRVQVPRWI